MLNLSPSGEPLGRPLHRPLLRDWPRLFSSQALSLWGPLIWVSLASPLPAQPKGDESSSEPLGANLSVDRRDPAHIHQLSLELSAIPTPPSAFEERRFIWLKSRQTSDQAAQEDKGVHIDTNSEDSEEREGLISPESLTEHRYLPPPQTGALQRVLSGLRGVGGYLPRAALQSLGQGFPRPLNQSKDERYQNLFSPDAVTDLKSPPLRYTSVYTPSVAPHARETVYNGVSERGELYLKGTGALKARSPLVISKLSRCLKRGDLSLTPSAEHSLLIGRRSWISPRTLDLTCARSVCRQAGVSCYLGSYDIRDWSHPSEARGLSSVAPSQQLALISSTRELRLSSDEADNLYMSSQVPLKGLSWLHMLVAVKRSYLTGSWRSVFPAQATLSAVKGQGPHLFEHARLATELPQDLKRSALSLTPRLTVSSKLSYHEVLFKLTSWHRSFSLGALPSSQSEAGGLYERLLISQRGVCRHRSYSFLITARALGVPTRLVVNAAHAFVEVLDPSGAWRRVDLGGEGPFLERPLDQRSAEVSPEPRPRDGLPEPPAYRDAQARGSEALSAYYQRPLAEQRALQVPLDLKDTGPRAAGGSQLSAPQGSLLGSSLRPRSSVELEFLGVGSVYSSETRSSEQVSERVGSSLPTSMQSRSNERGVRHDSRRPDEDVPHTPLTEDRASGSSPPLSPSSPPAPEDFKCLTPPKRLARTLRPPQMSTAEASSYPLELSAQLKGSLKPLRCEWLEVTGRVSLPQAARGAKALRAKLKSTYVQLQAVSERGAVTPLEGWARLNRNGRFSLSARLPIKLSSEQLSLRVHLPRQGPWSAVSAPVYQR